MLQSERQSGESIEGGIGAKALGTAPTTPSPFAAARHRYGEQEQLFNV